MTEVLYNYVPKTLILDLDETLISSYENPTFLEQYMIYLNPQIYEKFHYPPITYSTSLMNHDGPTDIWGLQRPFLHEFLHYCENYFDNIIVWSAGIKPYVEYITHDIFRNYGHQLPRIIWSRDHCANYGNLYHKPIQKLIDSGMPLDPKMTLIVDDRNHTFMDNPKNGILIPQYRPGKNNARKMPNLYDLLNRDDISLIELIRWFELPEVKYATDYRLLDKSKIFS